MIGVAELFDEIHESTVLRVEWALALKLEQKRARRSEYERRPDVVARRKRREASSDAVARRRARIRISDHKRYWSDPVYRERKKRMALQWAADNKERRRERRRRNKTK